MRKLAKLTVLLSVLVLLSGCGPSIALIATDDLCKSWRHQPTHKGDKITEKTAAVIEGNNEARPAWGCAPGKNEAAQPGS
jgi:hypothetical protein